MKRWIVLSFVLTVVVMGLVVRKKLRVDFMPKASAAVGDAGAPATPLAPPIGQPLPTAPPANPPAAVSSDANSALPAPSNMPIPADPPTNAKAQANDTVVTGAPDPTPAPPSPPALPPAPTQQTAAPSMDDPTSALPANSGATVQRDQVNSAQRKTRNSTPPSPTTSPYAYPTPQELDPSMKFIATDAPYDPTGLRDPFNPYFSIEQSDSTGLPSGTPSLETNTTGLSFLQPTPESQMSESLEASDVSKFRLLGILWEVNDPKAMVVSPGGKTYILHKQTRIGRNNGYVAAIREGEVVVVEVSVDGKTPTTRVLSLQK